jgi:phosphoglycerate dehydrogenase-like enzyme
MKASLLIIDETYADHYRDEVRSKFPDVEVHTALTREDVQSDVAARVDAMWGIGTQRIFGDEVVAKAGRLKWIQAFTAGTDGILGLPSLRRDIQVTCMRGIHGPQMSEMAFLFMIGLARNAPRILRSQQKGVWDRFEQVMLHGKTVAIVGIGIIGADLALRARACGMRVVGVSRTPRELEGFDEMLSYERITAAAAKADFLVVVTSYSAETHKLIGRKVLDAMKPSAYLVNISRGGVVDEEALLETLQARRIAGAGLDVFATEPLPQGHPFWTMDHVMVTPHQGGGSDFMPALQTEILEHNLRCFLDGRMKDMMNIVAR